MINIQNLRKEYSKASLDATTIQKNPIRQFEEWFRTAIDSKVLEPNAMTLSTVSEGNRPSARIVLLKGLESDKFTFYTNYQSQKGKELLDNPACALTFFWPELERQVRVEGVATRIQEGASEEYFHNRPRESQLGAWASPQSAVIKDRMILEARTAELEKKFAGGKEIPKPKQWGGFSVDPHEIEFWQGRPSRLHDRIVFYKENNSWTIHRLAP